MIHCIFSLSHAFREYLNVAIGIWTAPCCKYNVSLKDVTASFETRYNKPIKEKREENKEKK